MSDLPAGFVPDAPAGGAELPPGFVPDAPISKAQSFVRGVGQGLTMGFADEAAGIADYLLTGKPYAVGRDESRAKNMAARAENPLTYAAGDVAGGVATAFVPGLGVAKGATTAARIGKAAGLGAVSGVGYSEAQDAGQLFLDTAKGGLIGAVGGVASEGVGRLIGGAPKRADDRLIQGITEGAKPSIGEKLAGKAGARRPDVLEAVRADPALAKAARSGDADRLYAEVRRTGDQWKQARDVFYTQVDGTGERISPYAALQKLETVRKGLEASPETVSQADKIGGVMDDVARAWNTKQDITARELRKVVSGLQEDARSFYRASVTGGVPPDAAAAKKAAADALRDLLHEHVEAAATKHGLPGVDKLREINKRMSILADIEDAAATKATREAKVPPHRLGWLMDVGLGVSQPVALVAKKVLIDSGLGREAAAVADDVLAAWVRGAQQGMKGAQLKALATQLGIGTAAADALGVWAQDKFGVQVDQ